MHGSCSFALCGPCCPDAIQTVAKKVRSRKRPFDAIACIFSLSDSVFLNEIGTGKEIRHRDSQAEKDDGEENCSQEGQDHRESSQADQSPENGRSQSKEGGHQYQEEDRHQERAQESRRRGGKAVGPVGFSGGTMGCCWSMYVLNSF